MTKTREEIRENIIEAIVAVNENALRGYYGNCYAAYMTPDGEIYYRCESDMNTVPESVWNGTDHTICKKQSNGNLWEDAKDDKYELYITLMSLEQKEEISSYIENKKQEESEFYDGEFEPETLRDWSIDWIDKNYPEIMQQADDWVISDIVNEIRNNINNYEDIIEDLVDWCCDEDKEI